MPPTNPKILTRDFQQSAVASPAAARQSITPVFAGNTVFQAIVTVVRNRAGLDYSSAFRAVSAGNADLFEKAIDATKHTGPLLRLLNRTQSANGLSGVASTELAADNVARLTSQFFPTLNAAPISLQWDVISRAATALEKCGVPFRLLNRASAPAVNPADWKAANARASAVLASLEAREAKYDDIGLCDNYQSMNPAAKCCCFKSQIDRLMHDEGLTVSAAFERLKETQPVFWADALLNFEPQK